ncbi:MAG: dihydrolipoyl dehydrogenase [Actinobacteria bacterium]|nr:dihydrolipoyl dehydrogenase [Actinomycetota bacterium]
MGDAGKRIVVLGSGPGGYVAAIRAAQRGADVTVVEKGLVGGVCLNRGCIPTKTLIAGVDVLTKARSGDIYGFTVTGEVTPNWAYMQARKEEVVTQLRNGIHTLFKKSKVKLISGNARLSEPGVVMVDTVSTDAAVSQDAHALESIPRHEAAPAQKAGAAANIADVLRLEADAVIVATGSDPLHPAFFDFSQPSIIDSTELLNIESIPSSLLILGGGPIGCEFACLFADLGTKVTIVELMPQLLPQEDARAAKQFQSALRKSGVEVLVRTRLERVDEYAPDHVTVALEDGRTLTAEKMLIGVGRQPNTAGIGLEAVGVAMDERGYVIVNEHLETSVPGIYAIGDVTGGYLQAHVASHEGIVAVDNILGGRRERNLRFVPICLYGRPEIARIGLTEDEARDEGFRPVTGTFRFGALGRALALGESRGYVQLVVDHDSDKLLGAVMMGPHVTDVIHEVAVALEAGMSARRLGEIMHAHPTISEAVMEAAQDVYGESVHVAG